MAAAQALRILCIVPGNRHNYTCAETIEGLYANGCQVSAYCPKSDGCNENKLREQDIVDEKSARQLADEVDWIVIFCQHPHFGNGHDTIEGSALAFLDEWNKWDKSIFVDGAEYNWHSQTTWFHPHSMPRFDPFNWTYMKRKCRFYFKRECYLQDYKEGYIPYPFAFSVAGKTVDLGGPVEKDTDVFCSFPQNWTGLRGTCMNVCNWLKQKAGDIFSVDMRTDYTFPEYCRKIASSFISLDACGGGQVNARIWELAAYGTAPFRQEYSVVIPHDFEVNPGEGQMMVEFKDERDLFVKLLSYVKDRTKLRQMGILVREHLFKYHTTEKRVRYLLDIVQGRLKPEDCITPSTKQKFGLGA